MNTDGHMNAEEISVATEVARFGGRVVRGDGRGRGLGFPTANVAPSAGRLPADGVYACWVRFEAMRGTHAATLSVGSNPTFDDVLDRRLEAYVHDVDEDLYGQEVSVIVIARLRDMVRFDSLDDLIRWTADDVRRSRLLLAKAP